MKYLSSEISHLIANRFKVLAEPIRLEILHFLGSDERTVNEIAQSIGATQPNVSKHLKLMQEAGILGRRQEKNKVYYSVADTNIFSICDTVCNLVKEQVENQMKILTIV